MDYGFYLIQSNYTCKCLKMQIYITISNGNFGKF